MRQLPRNKVRNNWNKREDLFQQLSTTGTSGTRFFGLFHPVVPPKTVLAVYFPGHWNKRNKKLPIEDLRIGIRDAGHTFGRLSAYTHIYAREVVPCPTNGVHHA